MRSFRFPYLNLKKIILYKTKKKMKMWIKSKELFNFHWNLNNLDNRKLKRIIIIKNK